MPEKGIETIRLSVDSLGTLYIASQNACLAYDQYAKYLYAGVPNVVRIEEIQVTYGDLFSDHPMFQEMSKLADYVANRLLMAN